MNEADFLNIRKRILATNRKTKIVHTEDAKKTVWLYHTISERWKKLMNIH